MTSNFFKIKHSFLFLHFVFSISLQAQEKNILEPFKDIIKAEQKGNASKLDFVASTASSDYDLKYHRMFWEINPDIYYIKGAITSYFVPLTDDFSKIHFDLSDSLNVDSVKFHNKNLAYNRFNHDVLEINLPDTLPSKHLDSITVYYQGIPDSLLGFGSFKMEEHSQGNIIWTLSEPYGSREWWPCKQSLTDKIDSIDVIVSTPSQNKVAGNGQLVNTLIIGDKIIYHWKHRYPVATYLIAIGVTNYATYSDYVPLGNDSLEVLNYVYPDNLEETKKRTKDVIPFIQIYTKLFGDYPFLKEKYGHAQFGWGGGMENQTMSFMGGFNFDLNSHELAHQWFGDKVTCGTWSDIWLNEGFATYCTGLCYEQLSPDLYWKIWKSNNLSNVTSLADGSVFVDDTSSVSRIFDGRLSYSKGALVLHMLRWTLGDSVFFKGLKNYLSDEKLAYKYARTADLKNHLEIAGGKNLSEFFADWIYGQGFPSYNVLWSQDSAYKTTVTINQTQSHSSVSFFEMPLAIEFKSNIKDTVIVFNNNFNDQSFTINLNFKADSAFIDPTQWLISKNNSIHKLIADDVFSLFPNPTRDNLFLEFGKGVRSIEIIDISGKLIRKINIENYQVSLKINLNISDLTKGTYFVKMNRAQNSLLKKFIKV